MAAAASAGETDRQTRSAVSHAHAFPFSNGRRSRVRTGECRKQSPPQNRAERTNEPILNQISPIHPSLRFTKGGSDGSRYNLRLLREGESDAAFWDVCCVRAESVGGAGAVCFVRKQLNVILMTEVFSCRAPSLPFPSVMTTTTTMMMANSNDVFASCCTSSISFSSSP